MIVQILYAFVSPLNPGDQAFGSELERHGDGVKDVAFLVDDATGIYNKAVKRGAKGIKEPEELKDENGSVVIATVQTYGDTFHTFVERRDFKGVFLPGFRKHHNEEKFNKLIDDAKTSTDIKVRTKFYMSAQVLQNEQMPLVPIAHSRTFKAMAANIKGYKQDPLGQDYLASIIVE